ncbi:MAG: exosortase system-associated protein, TIGR04073 family [Verrucomicrobia bacterium]|nr:exosortase system-associated protein, TIGR04073 family [Verrucomicrobiota bacterium]
MKSSLLGALAAVALLSAGCEGMERKLGRGLMNTTEMLRGGEMMRSVEQTALYDGPEMGYTVGFVRGFDRTFIRTMLGITEVITFPIPTPTYDPIPFPTAWMRDPYTRLPVESFSTDAAYPENFRPGLIADSMFFTDTHIGFSGGEVAPFIPGSRFRVFDH